MINAAKEAIRQAVFPTPQEAEHRDYSALISRINKLESADHEYEIFRIIESGTSGRIALPDGVAIRLDQYPGAADCLITGGSGGRPLDECAYTADGVLITGTLDADGAYSLSGVPASYPVFIVFQVECKGKDAVQITLAERV